VEFELALAHILLVIKVFRFSPHSHHRTFAANAARLDACKNAGTIRVELVATERIDEVAVILITRSDQN
jgi:hypothetical protein